MNLKIERALDKIGVKILRELQLNARTSLSEIGRKAGLSPPAVAERVHKMEDAGIIRGYQAKIDPEKIGFPILAFIYLTTQSEKYPKVYTFTRNNPEIIECHCISGGESFILRVISSSIPELDNLVEKLNEFGETKTSIVLSSPVNKSSVEVKI